MAPEKDGQELTFFREIPILRDATGIMEGELYGSINTALNHNVPVLQIAGHFASMEVS